MSIHDIKPGDRFSRLEVLQTPPRYIETQVGDRSYRYMQHETECDCGTIKWIHSSSLWLKRTHSCGCLSKNKPPKFTISTGDRFGRLVVTATVELPTTDKQRKHRCVCDCGDNTYVRGSALQAGGTSSCGCLSSEKSADHAKTVLSKINTTHGFSWVGDAPHPLYRKWCTIKGRCHNPKNFAYRRYGARGIGVCDEWRNSFQAFYDWSMANGWNEGLSLDRFPNQNGNYEPNNCRYADNLGQANNISTNKLVSAFGETKTIAEWGRDQRCKVRTKTLYKRITGSRRPGRAGRKWDPEEAIVTPPAASSHNEIVKHGLTGHPLFKKWAGIKYRCYNENSLSYVDYGAKGIRVCDEWVNNFQAFYDWSMTNGWQRGLSLDRFPDGSGDYAPDNCRYTDHVGQANNISTNLQITAFSETKTPALWYKDQRCTVRPSTIIARINRGWDTESAITTPSDRKQS